MFGLLLGKLRLQMKEIITNLVCSSWSVLIIKGPLAHMNQSVATLYISIHTYCIYWRGWIYTVQ